MKKKLLKSAGLLIILLLLGVLFFFPVYWTIITSFKTKAQVFVERPILWIDTLYLDNYIEIFRKSYVATFFSNSMLVAVSTTVISWRWLQWQASGCPDTISREIKSSRTV